MKNSLVEILDNIEVLVYVADLKTYEILYVNEYTRRSFGDIKGKICWQSLQVGQNGPCSFCTNDKIVTAEGKPTGVYHWEFQNTISGKWFDIRDTAIDWEDGRTVRLEVATDITERKKTEEALKFRSGITEQLNASVITTGLDLKITWVNQAFSSLYGYSADEVIGQTPDFLNSDPLSEKIQSDIYLTVSSGGIWTGEAINRRKDGTTFLCELDIFPLKNDSGNIFAYAGHQSDITDRKQAEKDLIKKQYDLTKAQEMGSIGTWELDLLKNQLIWTDQNYRNFGVPIGTPLTYEIFLGCVHPDDRDYVHTQWSAALNGKPYDIEHRLIVDGKVRWVREKADVEFDENRKAIKAIGFTQDITEHKKAEDKLRESETFIRTVLNNLPIGIAVNSVDPNVTFDYMNNNFPMCYRTTKEKLAEPDAFWDSVYEDPKFRKEMKKRVLDDCSSGDPERMYWVDVPIARKGEETAFITARNIPIPDKHLMISTVWDVTKRKQVEQALEHLNDKLKQKNKELEQLVSITSHDLRTPLVNIAGYSKEITKSLKEVAFILQNAEDLTVAKEKVSLIVESDIAESESYISKNIFKMENLLSALLNLSRLGQQELKKEKLNMNNMMADIAKLMTYQVANIDTKLELSELPFCVGDAIQINQLFSNLIGNALKYLDSERSGVIKVSGRKEHNHSVYCVEDNGIGIAPEHQEKIFEIFYQLEPSKVNGEGLGLSIARKVVNSHGGKIWVESELCKGSKFFVSLPED